MGILLPLGLFLTFLSASAALFTFQENSTDPGKLKNHDPVPWYGTSQKFGSPGLAQRWINILGQVDSQAAATLSYSLNNGPEQSLNLGPDSRRLSSAGDFNVDLDAQWLHYGTNTLRLTALTEDGSASQLDIAIRFNPGKWPLPYAVNWQKVTSIQEAVQVVDGLWLQTEKGLRTSPDRIGYDRSFAIGDADWKNYEVLFPLTVHRVAPDAYSSPESAGPGLGIILHWQGHTDTPVNCGQPHCGWLPSGAQSWYFFKKDKTGGMNIITEPLPLQTVALPYDIHPGTTYMLRARVVKKPFRNLYSMKLWRQDEPEPEKWSLVHSGDVKNPDSGGLLVVAHHVDMTVGNVEVHPVITKEVQSAGNLTAWSHIKEYLVPLPLLITLTAGVCLVWRQARPGNIFTQKIAGITCLAIAGLLVILLAEPFFPDILSSCPLNAKQTATLYLGLDLGRMILQAVIWLMIFLYLMKKRETIE